MWHALKARWFWLLAGLVVLVIVVVVWRAAAIGVGHTKPGRAAQAQLQSKATVPAASSRNAKATTVAERKTVAVATTTATPNQHPTEQLASPLPAAGTPYLELYAQLHGRAEEGDLAAARRLYHDAVKCNRYLTGLEIAQMETMNPIPAPSLDGWRLKETAENLDSEVRYLQENKDTCGGLTPSSLAAVASKALWDAGRLGDISAARCYVSATLAPPDYTITDPHALQRFRAHTEFLIQVGLEQGDWRMIPIIQRAYAHSLPSSNKIMPNEPAKVYTFVRLQWLGATSAGAQSDIKMTQWQLPKLAAELPPDVVAAANDQAQRIYDDYFVGHPYLPMLDEGFVECSTGKSDTANNINGDGESR